MKQGTVRNFQDKRMAKCMQTLFIGRQIVEQLRLPKLPKGFREIDLGKPCDEQQDRKRELAAYNRSCLQNLFCSFF